MTTPVYVTHGRKYHADRACRLMRGGEDLHDWDGDEYGGGFIAGSYRREDQSPQYAAMRGKWPCLLCVPPELRAFPPLYGQTFGHEPATGISLLGIASQVCQRCTEPGVWYCTADEMRPVHIPWPCTSARILRLPAATECRSQCPRHPEHVCRRSPRHQAGICRDAKQKGTETCTWDPAGGAR